MPNDAALDAMQTQIKVLQIELARVIEGREADNARWKQFVDAITNDRDRISKLFQMRWNKSRHDQEESQ